MSLKYLHVNRHIIASNRKTGKREAPLVARTRSGKGCYGRQIDIYGADGQLTASLVYTPNQPLKCGAVAYVVARFDVKVRKVIQCPSRLKPASTR